MPSEHAPSRPSAVAVVIPCRDASLWVCEALDSLLHQTRPPDEVVVVDDGSADDSSQRVLDWIAANGTSITVRLLQRPRRGLRAALAAGIAATDSALLCRLDADDRLTATYLEVLEAALSEQPSAGYAYPRLWMFGDVEGFFYTRDFSAPSLVLQGNFACAGALMRRTAYEASGGVADLPAWEDWDLWLRFLEAGFEGVLVEEAIYEWRRHGATRNKLTWTRRRWLRLRIWWRHRRLVLRYLPRGSALLYERLRNPVRKQ
jgi:glycosyltransferase involved in cell wall biosynthesis